MPFSLSPSISVQETDLSTSAVATASSVGGIVGDFAWGPCDVPMTISNEDDLVSMFGAPTTLNYKDWFSGSNYLSYTGHLEVIRVIDATAVNSGDLIAQPAVRNEDDFVNVSVGTGNSFIGKYPGLTGNSIVVEAATSANFSGWVAEDLFDQAPVADEVWIAVYFDGVVVETFETSTITTKKDYKNDSYYIGDVVNRGSKYVYVIVDNFVDDTVADGINDNNGTYTLSNGLNSVAVGSAERILGWDIFANPDSIDVSFLIVGGADYVTQKYVVDNVSEVRKDCVAFISPIEDDVVAAVDSSTSIVTGFWTTAAMNASTYAFADGNYKYQYDKYNDVYMWVPLNGDIAGLTARTETTNDAWYSPAGFNRGHIKNVIKLAFNPTKAQRDVLYKNAINSVVNFKGEGTVLYGDKTFTNKPSSFGYINVRRLFIVIEKAISTAAKYSMFEFNDNFSRNRFSDLVTPFLRDVKSRRGVFDFMVVADQRVNTEQVVDAGEFRADIYIKPTRSIQNIQLNFVSTKSGVSFQEITG